MRFVNSHTIEKLLQDGEEIEVVGRKFTVPSIDHLPAMKFHVVRCNKLRRSFKDLPEIVRLAQRNNIAFTSDRYQKLCLKYGDEEIYKNILRALGH